MTGPPSQQFLINSFLTAVCVIFTETLGFYLRKINHTIFTKVGLSFISVLSLTLLIFNHQKALLLCLTYLHTDFQIVS